MSYLDDEQSIEEFFGPKLSKKAYTDKHRRVNTTYFYEQQKFNLLREENEGWSKLFIELN